MSLVQRKAIVKLEERINNDKKIMERSMEINKMFFDRVKKIVSIPENEYFLSGMIENIKRETPRYSFIKNVDFAGKKVDVEIDELMREFRVIEI